MITQDEGEDCDFRWFALYFWTKSLCSKDRFIIIFLYKQHETKAWTVSFPSEEDLELSMQKLEPRKTIWTNHKHPSKEILG